MLTRCLHGAEARQFARNIDPHWSRGVESTVEYGMRAVRALLPACLRLRVISHETGGPRINAYATLT